MNPSFSHLIPHYILDLCRHLRQSGYQSFIVGGAIRDLVLGKTPKDYDIATDALPDRVEELFDQTIPTGKKYGTVTVLLHAGETAEVTTFRGDAPVCDGRRPEHVLFSDQLCEDLAHRDFTVNAIAYDPIADRIVDPFDGLCDLKARRLRTVGLAAERFREDALRMMRAVRIKAEKGLEMIPGLAEAIRKDAQLIRNVNQERITEELSRIITSPRPAEGVYDLREFGLLQWILPELDACAGIRQREDYHRYDVFGHIARALQHTEPELIIRLAVLLHDIGKSATSTVDAGGVIHFYKHEDVGAGMAETILERMKFSHEVRQQVIPLIRHHMRNIDSDRALRRMISELKTFEQARRLVQIRFADQMAGRQDPDESAAGYHDALQKIARIEAQKLPLRVADLAVSGADIIRTLGIAPGPVVGEILQNLLRRVLEKPEINQPAVLIDMLPDLYRQITLSGDSGQ